jgi:imidazole glycerol phosphate synthase glutamine amidotransferase subunit
MTPPTLGLVDYGSGNLRSVAKALETIGARVTAISERAIPRDTQAVVLPGVGSFGDSVRQLQQRDLFDPLRAWLHEEKPFLGICLGYQLLFESSEESPGTPGLSILRGKVRRFSSPGVKIPQIGWNRIHWSPVALALYPGLPQDAHVYFVHSYFPQPADPAEIGATTEYGETFISAIARRGLLATQFHPEKSQETGLAILREFVNSLP